MDQQLLSRINREWTTPFLDWFMAAVSSLDAWIIPIVLLIAGMLIFGGFRGRMAVLSVALVLGVAEGLVIRVLKDTVGRPRPHEVMADVRRVELARKVKPRFMALFKPVRVRMSRPEAGEIRGRSFPSAHTTDNFCVAIILTLFFRRWGWLWFIPATAIAYSRVYTGSHWPSDVIVSIFLAFGITLLMMAGLEWAWRRFGAPRWPQYPTLFAKTKPNDS